MVYCYECKWFRHEAGVREGIPYEFFLCDARDRDIKRKYVDRDIPCKLFRAKRILRDGCSGDCDSCDYITSCPDVGY